MELQWISLLIKLWTILTLLEEILAGNLKSSYIGCYIDANPSRRLFNNHEEVIGNNSPKACVELCKMKNFAYAGMQYGTECFCGNERPTFKARADESECSTDCPGNKEEKCGAGWRTSAYKTGLPGLTPREKLDYIGCYADYGSVTQRLFDKYNSDFQEGQTPHYCVGLCYSLGFPYAALQYNFECFCGNNHPPAQKLLNDDECNLECTGDKTAKCGGNWRLSAYSTSITDIPALGRYIGCYIDNTNNVMVLNGMKRDFRITNTPQLCVNFCLSNNYDYAGLQYGKECYCGNDEITAELAPDFQCQLECPGDGTRMCGGHWRLAIYQLDVGTTFKAPQYLGCYKEKTNETRLFQGYKQNFHSSLTVQKCIDICRSKGFHYSGLQYRYECFCDDRRPPDSLLVGENDCLYPCSGDSSQMCGGDWRYSVHWNGLKNPLRNEGNYLGCFRERNAPLQLLPLESAAFETSLTPELCIDHCFRKGYPYSGTQITSVHFGTELNSQCHCGDFKPSTEHNTDASQCSAVCPGDKTKKCGGDWRLSVYRSGVYKYNRTFVQSGHLGCYLYDRRTFSQYKVDLHNNSPERCLGICKGIGYLLAGVKNGFGNCLDRNECYCGYKAPPSSSEIRDRDCSIPCSGDKSAVCGAANAWSVYKIPQTSDSAFPDLIDKRTPELCQRSKTEMVGKKTICSGDIIFQDDFHSLDLDKWQHSIRMSGNTFSYFTSEPDNSFVKDGVLHIHPKLLPDDNVTSGTLQLNGCTSLRSEECEREAQYWHILPPIASAEISTKNSFSFKYGVIEMRARLPVGDWLIPEMWLEPKTHAYGQGFSGKIKMAAANGNEDLITSNGKDISVKCLDYGVSIGYENNTTERYVTETNAQGWNENFHNYTMIWSPDDIKLIIDDKPLASIKPDKEDRLCTLLGQEKKCNELWARGTKMAPFDKEFYLTLGLRAGGINEFPDNCKSHGHNKPWKNQEAKAMLNFYEDRNKWYSTWRGDGMDLLIDYILVRAL